MPNNKEEGRSLDAILVQIGDFGKYQTFVLILISIVLILHSAVHIIFVFSAIELDYRYFVFKSIFNYLKRNVTCMQNILLVKL